MKNNILKITYLILLSVLLLSCTDTNVTPNTSFYLKVSEAISTGASFKVVMYANDTLTVGYSKVYFKVTDNKSKLTINNVNMILHPLMVMGATTHTCSSIDPPSKQNTDGLYQGAINFSMIGKNNWSVSVDVTAYGKTETVKLDIPIVIAAKP